MIKAVMVINTAGKVRLCQFYEKISIPVQQQLMRLLHTTISARGDGLCYFVDGFTDWPSPDTRVVYRCYATLCIIFITDSSESCLAILDLIQVFVEVLDRLFKNVCELDFLFHSEKVHRALSEIVMGGMVLEMSKEAVVRQLTEMDRLAVMSSSGSNGAEDYTVGRALWNSVGLGGGGGSSSTGGGGGGSTHSSPTVPPYTFGGGGGDAGMIGGYHGAGGGGGARTTPPPSSVSAAMTSSHKNSTQNNTSGAFSTALNLLWGGGS